MPLSPEAQVAMDRAARDGRLGGKATTLSDFTDSELLAELARRLSARP